MNTTLLIMAAGIGSRFGTGIKQLEPVDASNHIIMDYSIHDDMTSIIHWLQLFDSCSKTATDTGCHDK